MLSRFFKKPPVEKPIDVTYSEDQAGALLKDFLTDATKVRIYQLEQMAQRNVVARQEALNAAQLAFQQRQNVVITRATKAGRYRKQLNQLNAAHRLLKLEYKELKNKYDEALRGISKSKAHDNSGYAAEAGGTD